MNAPTNPQPLHDPTGATGRGAENVVTASTLVRHFGLWQERAAHEPVYILHRGRPRFVLATVEIMQALCSPRPPEQHGDEVSAFDALLAFTPQILMICNAALDIVAMSAAAHRYFAQPPGRPLPFERLADGQMMDLTVEAIRRVLATGHTEDVDMAPLRYPARRLRLMLHPHPLGVAMIAHDVSAVEEMQGAQATATAFEAASLVSGGVATARLGLRGYLEGASPSLAALTGLAADALTGARFVTLIDIADRARLGDAIEQVIGGTGAARVAATLHTKCAGALPVVIGLDAIRHHGAVVSVAVVIVSQPGLEALKAS